MKILFSLLHPGYVRNYESVIRLLAERGHEIHLVFSILYKQRDDRLAETLSEEYPNVSFGHSPKRYDIYKNVAWTVRWAMDYVRYLDPRYAHTELLRKRIEGKLRELSQRVGNYPLVLLNLISLAKGVERVRACIRVLQICERAIPPYHRISQSLTDFGADLVLVTPLVNAASMQVDYIRSAKSLGIRSAVCVASWDNLTNKGLLRIDPDAVFVWNDIQRWEAEEFHLIPRSKIVVTGAPRFDEWFGREPSYGREEFCEQVGLNPDQVFVLYFCSSPFIAPDEVPFVKSWLQKIRFGSCREIKDIGVLIRPHPQNAAQWKDVDLSEFGNVTIWPRMGAQPVDSESKAGFFDSLYHCAAVVGINTTAMIEAAIVGRPVHTILAPDFVNTQQGTLHFAYLLPEHGGFVRVADTLDEHLQQLSDSMARRIEVEEELRRFVTSFVRPCGIDLPATPIMVEAIERVGSLGRTRPEAMPLQLYPLRYLFGIIGFGVVCTDRAWLRKLLHEKWKSTDRLRARGRKLANPSFLYGRLLAYRSRQRALRGDVEQQ